MRVRAPFILVVLESGGRGVRNFLEATEVEIRMLVSALGKHALGDLDREDVSVLDHDLANATNVPFVCAG